MDKNGKLAAQVRLHLGLFGSTRGSYNLSWNLVLVQLKSMTLRSHLGLLLLRRNQDVTLQISLCICRYLMCRSLCIKSIVIYR